MNHRLFALLVVATPATSCSILSDPVVCTHEARPAITVEIRDSVTNSFVGAGARVIAADGSFADTAVASSDADVISLAHERPGNYTVAVRQAGYQEWTRAGIPVNQGTCHVQTVSVVALLQP